MLISTHQLSPPPRVDDTVSDREALLAAILADPADDTLRLVFADFLRETDDPNDRMLGRFIWAGVTAARFGGHDLIDDPLYYTAQREIASVAGAARPAHWLSALGLGPRPFAPRDWIWDSTLDRVTVRSGPTVGAFTRGMLAELVIGLDDWYELGAAILARWPVERVTFAESSEPVFWIDAPREDRPLWRLTGVSSFVVHRRPAGRRRRMGRLLAGLFGSPESEVPPVEPMRSVVADFPDRAAMLLGLAQTSARLIEELRCGPSWLAPQSRRA